jgi:hypothetical protein
MMCAGSHQVSAHRASGPVSSTACPGMSRDLARGQGSSGVGPVGFEPTLGTLLGGLPLPLGYGPAQR